MRQNTRGVCQNNIGFHATQPSATVLYSLDFRDTNRITNRHHSCICSAAAPANSAYNFKARICAYNTGNRRRTRAQQLDGMPLRKHRRSVEEHVQPRRETETLFRNLQIDLMYFVRNLITANGQGSTYHGDRVGEVRASTELGVDLWLEIEHRGL